MLERQDNHVYILVHIWTHFDLISLCVVSSSQDPQLETHG